MKSYYNIERSAFRAGEYRGWDRTGNSWRIYRSELMGGWQAWGVAGGYITGRTLGEVSMLLERYVPQTFAIAA